MNVSFNPLADQELNDAAQYYELESPGLGVAFLIEVQRCCDAIVEYPDAGHIVLGSIRRRLVRRFSVRTSLHHSSRTRAGVGGNEPEATTGLLDRPT